MVTTLYGVTLLKSVDEENHSRCRPSTVCLEHEQAYVKEQGMKQYAMEQRVQRRDAHASMMVTSAKPSALAHLTPPIPPPTMTTRGLPIVAAYLHTDDRAEVSNSAQIAFFDELWA